MSETEPRVSLKEFTDELDRLKADVETERARVRHAEHANSLLADQLAAERSTVASLHGKVAERDQAFDSLRQETDRVKERASRHDFAVARATEAEEAHTALRGEHQKAVSDAVEARNAAVLSAAKADALGAELASAKAELAENAGLVAWARKMKDALAGG